jgi:hypothetical protein
MLAETIIIPTIPGTDFEDYRRPRIVIQDDGTAYETIPGTNFRSYDRKSWKIKTESVPAGTRIPVVPVGESGMSSKESN